jgi:hypothetical protein
MGSKDQPRRLAPYAQELVENAYAQEKLRAGVDKLRAAYRRAQKRRVEPTRDEKVRSQVRSAAESITEAGRALRSGRRKPERRWGTRLAVIVGLGVAGVATVLWAKERLSDQPSGPTQAPSPAAADSTEATPQPAAA